MHIQFDPDQGFQRDAVAAVTGPFGGRPARGARGGGAGVDRRSRDATHGLMAGEEPAIHGE
jgi:hypothetical protein